jgi:hypothetical protein
MSDKEIDELDERRALCVPRQKCCWSSRYFCMSRPGCFCVDLARAIRLSDEAAGYELCKRVEHRGVIG